MTLNQGCPELGAVTQGMILTFPCRHTVTTSQLAALFLQWDPVNYIGKTGPSTEPGEESYCRYRGFNLGKLDTLKGSGAETSLGKSQEDLERNVVQWAPELKSSPQAHRLHAARLILHSFFCILPLPSGNRRLLRDSQAWSGLAQRIPWINQQGEGFYHSQLVGNDTHSCQRELRFLDDK